MKPRSVLADLLCEKAKSYVGEKETDGPNRSPLIDKINRFMKVPLGSSYCISAIQWILSEIEQSESISFHLPITASCLDFWNKCDPSVKHQTPEVGDLVLWRFGSTILGHAGIVIGIQPDHIETIEFNTSDGSGINREGDGVYRRIRSLAGSPKMKLLGFVRVLDSVREVQPVA